MVVAVDGSIFTIDLKKEKNMSQRAQDISKRIKSFADKVITFVESLTESDCNKICDGEDWTVGVTARHIGAAHFAISKMAAMIVRGEDLPPLSMDQINAMSEKDSRKHADCTKAEALELLRKNSAELAAFAAGLTDDELDRKGSMPAFGGEVRTGQLFDFIIFQSANQHFDSMRTAVGK
ncbi:MAG: DinB family protein [Proteobacteria bacterium]|nr:DinB family protein [Pseudomonadota bacterium]